MKERLQVKICGVTQKENAVACVREDIQLIGLNFYAPSPRAVSLHQAEDIVAAIRREAPEIRVVGVFVNEDPEVIQQIGCALSLDGVQLSGDEDWEQVAAFGGWAYRALRPRTRHDLKQAFDAVQDMPIPCPGLPQLLVDGWTPDQYGGTGQTVSDWVLQVARDQSRRWMLAGGVTPDNVGERLSQARPWGVDVASGVESGHPGIKDIHRVRALVQKIRQWEERYQ